MNVELKGTWEQAMKQAVTLLTSVHGHNTKGAQEALGDLAVLLRHVNQIERRDARQKLWESDDA